MKKQEKIKFEYYSSVEGHVVPRYGTDVYIGAKRVPGGWDWNTDAVVPIPEREYTLYGREYARGVKEGGIIKRTEADYKKYIKAKESANKKNSAEASKSEDAQ
jgi:hypothetical protein